MPATVSSRSVGPEPEMRMTAGEGVDAPCGLVIVAAMLKPSAGIVTGSSPGTEKAEVRDAAEAISSRAMSIICVGMFKRSSVPLVSVQRLIGRSPDGGGLLNVSE